MVLAGSPKCNEACKKNANINNISVSLLLQYIPTYLYNIFCYLSNLYLHFNSCLFLSRSLVTTTITLAPVSYCSHPHSYKKESVHFLLFYIIYRGLFCVKVFGIPIFFGPDICRPESVLKLLLTIIILVTF